MTGSRRVIAGPDGEVVIVRDGHGIPTIDARSEVDAWFGLGYAAAADRLWQMEYDRRRACGRWAEAAGPVAVEADRLARRLDVERAARVDVDAMSASTRAQFAAYAAGVNAQVAQGPLPGEYAAAELEWEAWEPWHSVAAFTIRHVLMGVWQHKLAGATVLAADGLAAFDFMDPGPLPGMPLIVPAGERLAAGDPAVRALLERARQDIATTAGQLGFLAEVEAGSNSWVAAGSRTTSGFPVLCNDSHRALDVPNVYWQAHLRCPQFAVSGGTFPGLPGFPHFGHNTRVGWAITHTGADAQDLLIEQFRDCAAGLQVRTVSGWEPISARESTICVRGGDPVAVACYATPNGPVVHGDPVDGVALSLRWTATEAPCRQFEVLRAMLDASTTTELLDAQAEWVDPVNNFLAADTTGGIGFVLRGALPVRTRPAALQVPVPGWEPESEWRGRVAFADLPREENPPGGVIVTANNTVVAPSTNLLISHPVVSFYRAERIGELLASREKHSFEDLAGYQGDVVSVAARAWAGVLARRGPYTGPAERARSMIVALDGEMDGDRAGPVVHACFRRVLAEMLLAERLSPTSVRALLRDGLPAGGVLVRRWFAKLTWPTGPDQPCPADDLSDAVLEAALQTAWDDACRMAGDDPRAWCWSDHHFLGGQHTLAPAVVDESWNPPQAPIGGDDETVQHASYPWPRAAPFHATTCSVYRQVLDFSDLDRSEWVIPGGASADHTSPHYADQLPLWARHERLPMTPVDRRE